MTAIVLAAGKSRRMRSSIPKVLLPLRGRPVLAYVIDAARAAGFNRIMIVVGSARRQVEAAFPAPDVDFVVQERQRGTADAVLCCRELLDDDEECVVLCGDTPLLTGVTIKRLLAVRRESEADVAVLTARFTDPHGYGRIVRGNGDRVRAIVEERDATEEIRRITEINAGVYAFRWGRLLPVLERINPSPVTGEYYLTDAVRDLEAKGGQVVAVVADDGRDIMGINTPEQFETVAVELERRDGQKA